MKFITVVMVVYSLMWSGIHAEDENIHPVPLQPLVDAMAIKIRDLSADATISTAQGFLTVAWKTRAFQVHRRIHGGWAKETETITGPELDGCQIRMVMSRHAYQGSLMRGSVPVFSKERAYRDPYWYASFSLLDLKNLHVQVNIFFGEAADLNLAEKIYNVMVSVIREREGEKGK